MAKEIVNLKFLIKKKSLEDEIVFRTINSIQACFYKGNSANEERKKLFCLCLPLLHTYTSFPYFLCFFVKEFGKINISVRKLPSSSFFSPTEVSISNNSLIFIIICTNQSCQAVIPL